MRIFFLYLTATCLLASSCKERTGITANAASLRDSQTAVSSQMERKSLGMVRTDPDDSPMTAQEIARVTDDYLKLLATTRYFHVLDERIHGWPETDASKPPFGIWWSGVQLERRSGKVVYRHHQMGSDNAAADTAMMLESLCFARRLGIADPVERTLRRTARGLAALAKSMHSASHQDRGTMLARSFYPVSVTSKEQDVPILYDYGRARPGDDNGATSYVHINDNPYWGDIWIKNTRSKDDMGHVLRGLSQTQVTCDDEDLLAADTKQAIDEAKSQHMLWAIRLKQDNWTIATIDKEGTLWYPHATLANFFSIGGAECDAFLGISLFGGGDPGGRDCGNGYGGLGDAFSGLNDQNMGIMESYHQAALMAALEYKRVILAKSLAQGLAKRATDTLNALRNGTQWSHYKPEQLAALLIRNASMGIPLTHREARWIAGQITTASRDYATTVRGHEFDFLHKVEPDNVYPYTPPGLGLLWRDIGAVLGMCSSKWGGDGAQVVDCQKIATALRQGS